MSYKQESHTSVISFEVNKFPNNLVEFIADDYINICELFELEGYVGELPMSDSFEFSNKLEVNLHLKNRVEEFSKNILKQQHTVQEFDVEAQKYIYDRLHLLDEHGGDPR